jgi:hypothetical protein
MKFVDLIKTILHLDLKEPKSYGKYDSDELFSIGIGELCESCKKELDLYKGGFRGEPTKCESCSVKEDRDKKLSELGI